MLADSITQYITNNYSNVTIQRGEALISKMEKHRIDYDFISDNSVIFGTRFGGSKYYHVSASFTYENNSYTINTNCSCPCNFHCKHTFALLLAIYRQQSFVIDAMKEDCDEQLYFDEPVIKTFNINEIKNKLINIEQTEIKESSYLITPLLKQVFEEKYNFSLSFQISKDGKRPYIIKNIYEFYESMMNKETKNYGKNLEVLHDIDLFVNKEFVSKILELIGSNYRFLDTITTSGWRNPSLTFEKKFLATSLFTLKNLLVDYEGSIFKIDDENYVYRANEKLNICTALVEGEIRTFISNSEEFLVEEDYYISFEGQYFFINKFSNNISANLVKGIMINRDPITLQECHELKNTIFPLIANDVDTLVDDNIDFSEIEVNPLEVYVTRHKNDVLVEYENDNTKYYNELNLLRLNKLTPSGTKYSGIEELLEFIKVILPEIYNYADVVHVDESIENIKLIEDFNITIDAKVKKGSLELQLLTTNFDSSELMDVIKHYNSNHKYHETKTGQYIVLDNVKIKQLEEVIDGLNLKLSDFSKNKVSIDKYRSMYLDLKLKSLDIKLEKNATFTKLLSDINSISHTEFEVPKVIDANLRTYQQEGYNWLKHINHYGFGAILADDMGLGKTLQTITLLSSCTSELPSIVVAPASLGINWAKECDKFNKEMKVVVVSQTKKERKIIYDNIDNYDLVITSYDILKRDIDLISELEFNYAILDEAQYIKNHSTQVAKSVLLIKSQNKLALSGTPIENNLAELWSIFNFLMPGYLNNYNAFKNKYETPITKNNDTNKLNELKNLVSPFILRRLKTEVLSELPEKIENIVYAEMSNKQRKVYDANVLILKEMLTTSSEEEINSSKLHVLKMLTVLRQVCCHPILVDKTYSGESCKYDAVIELLNELKASGSKTILFSQFTKNFEALKPILQANGITYVELTGKTNKNKRYEMVDVFNNDDTDLFLISLKAGGTGLNIVGANTVIHLDPWWNVSAENQATDRVHRIGQKNNVNVYKVIIRDTIEEKIINMQNEKNALANSILSDNNVNIKSMSKNDIINLITR